MEYELRNNYSVKMWYAFIGLFSSVVILCLADMKWEFPPSVEQYESKSSVLHSLIAAFSVVAALETAMLI